MGIVDGELLIIWSRDHYRVERNIRVLPHTDEYKTNVRVLCTEPGDES